MSDGDREQDCDIAEYLAQTEAQRRERVEALRMHAAAAVEAQMAEAMPLVARPYAPRYVTGEALAARVFETCQAEARRLLDERVPPGAPRFIALLTTERTDG